MPSTPAALPDGLAVIVQRMAPADRSGVAFGLHPLTGNRSEKVISAVYGLGEGLVGGAFDADTFVVEREIRESRIATKTHQIRFDPAAEKPGLMEVPLEWQPRPAMTDVEVMQVANALDAVQDAFGTFQDIEFAFAGGQLYLLQARPVTALGSRPDAGGLRRVWDNSNIVESYPGLTQPLTFSFIRRMYEAVYRQFCGLMGVSDRELEANSPVFAAMLGLVQGRVYYNLHSWYQTLALLPGYRLNARFMEQMMGVRERFDVATLSPASRSRAWLGLAVSALKVVWAHATLRRQTRRFENDVQSILAEFDGLSFQRERPEVLVARYRQLESFLLRRWRAPLVNDFFAMIYFGLLKRLVASWIPAARAGLHNDLLAGSHDLRSTEPLQRLRAICQAIGADEAALTLFQTGSPAKVWRRLPEPAFSGIEAMIGDYLQIFGERCSGELQLETKTWRQQPETFIALLQGYLRDEVFARPAGPHLGSSLRQDAEAVVKETLRRHLLRRLVFGYVLTQTRRLVSNRENLRLQRTWAFGMVRRLFSALGRRLQAEAVLDQADDIFYLSQDEIFHWIEGQSPQDGLRGLVALRRTDYQRWEAGPAPASRFCTYGPVYAGNDFQEAAPPATGPVDLHGLGCCAGRVRGRARVITDPRQAVPLNGEILVAACTDPGWITLFPSAAAIAVERGSLLSHSAIVARELGLPCVVGVSGLLARVRTGDLLELDGAAGTIRILTSTDSTH